MILITRTKNTAMKQIALLLIIVFGIGILITSCKKPNVVNPNDGNEIEEVHFPNDFKWNTYNDIPVVIYGQEDGMVTMMSLDGKTYHKAYLTANKELTFKLVVPTYEEKVLLLYKDNNIEIELTGDPINYQF